MVLKLIPQTGWGGGVRFPLYVKTFLKPSLSEACTEVSELKIAPELKLRVLCIDKTPPPLQNKFVKKSLFWDAIVHKSFPKLSDFIPNREKPFQWVGCNFLTKPLCVAIPVIGKLVLAPPLPIVLPLSAGKQCKQLTIDNQARFLQEIRSQKWNYLCSGQSSLCSSDRSSISCPLAMHCAQTANVDISATETKTLSNAKYHTKPGTIISETNFHHSKVFFFGNCKSAKLSQHNNIKLSFCLFVFFCYFCYFCLFCIFVKIQKWHSLTESLTDWPWPRSGKELPGQLETN